MNRPASRRAVFFVCPANATTAPQTLDNGAIHDVTLRYFQLHGVHAGLRGFFLRGFDHLANSEDLGTCLFPKQKTRSD
jgi:hypothetical protein